MNHEPTKKKRGPYACKHITADIVTYRRNYYLSRVKKGICTQCGNPKGKAKGTQCAKCKASVNKKSKKCHAAKRAEKKNLNASN